jgi:uncharacterized membrane protein YbhN (UPF0104 family)
MASRRRRVIVRVVLLVVAAVAQIQVRWFLAMILLEAGSFVCAWALLRVALGRVSWFAVGTAQLTSNAFSRLIPGGALTGGATLWRLLGVAGIDSATAGGALAAIGLVSTSVLLALPLLVKPLGLIGWVAVPQQILALTWFGFGLFVILFAVSAILLSNQAPLRVTFRLIGRAVDRSRGRVGDLAERLPERVESERVRLRGALETRWGRALAAAGGNWVLDYLSLYVAVRAVGADVNPGLVLLAYVAAAILAMIPLTPGGLGFVEAGLTATLGAIGVLPGDAVLATLAYRLVSYWLPIPSGLVAYGLFRRRYGHAAAAAAMSDPDDDDDQFQGSTDPPTPRLLLSSSRWIAAFFDRRSHLWELVRERIRGGRHGDRDTHRLGRGDDHDGRADP